MASEPRFEAAYPYKANVLALPVADIDAAAAWYCRCFGMTELERTHDPVPTVILERDGMRLGFAVNGGDASQDGAAILVAGIAGIREQLLAEGVKAGDLSVQERHENGREEQLTVFFAIAPDGLCYYFHEPLE